MPPARKLLLNKMYYSLFRRCTQKYVKSIQWIESLQHKENLVCLLLDSIQVDNPQLPYLSKHKYKTIL